jgi:hypothetical protein
MYFELWLATTLLEIIVEHSIDEIDAPTETKLASDIAALFDVDVQAECTSLAGVIEYFVRVRKHIDFVVNNSALSGNLDGITVTFSHGRLIFGIPQIFEKLVSFMAGKTVIYLIDEAENLTADQQKFLNTLIRFRKGNATIRVGARLYGIRTYETLGSGEPNKLDAEFHQLVLDGFLREQKGEYAKLIEGLVVTRLKRLNRAPNGTDTLEGYFAGLDREEQWRAATLELARKYDSDGRERPYLKRLRGYVESAFPGEPELADGVIKLLRSDDHPLVEKASVFMLYRQWPAQKASLLKIAKVIGDDAQLYCSGQRGGQLSQTLDYFRSDLLAQFYRDCRQRVPFAGLKTLTELSQGIPRNFLTILKYTYRRSFKWCS